MNTFEKQLVYASQLPIKHISIYEFQYKNTEKRFLEKDYSLREYKKILEEKKFFLYEINSFSKKGYQSRYNKSVLGMKNYVGIGPSAHGRVHVENNFFMLKNTRNLKRWLSPEINPYRKEILSNLEP